MEQFNNPNYAQHPDRQQQPNDHLQQHQHQHQQIDYGDYLSDDDEAEDEVAPLVSETGVRQELDEMMKAMKFRVYYDEDDPRGDLKNSAWDDQKREEQLTAEKLKSLKE